MWDALTDRVSDAPRDTSSRSAHCTSVWWPSYEALLGIPFVVMRAKGWHSGRHPEERAGYGIKFEADDRDRHFDRDWEDVLLVFDDREIHVRLSESFWRSCSELRSADLGQWMLDVGAAPWPKGNPPSIAVNPIERNTFSAHLITRRSIL